MGGGGDGGEVVGDLGQGWDLFAMFLAILILDKEPGSQTRLIVGGAAEMSPRYQTLFSFSFKVGLGLGIALVSGSVLVLVGINYHEKLLICVPGGSTPLTQRARATVDSSGLLTELQGELLIRPHEQHPSFVQYLAF